MLSLCTSFSVRFLFAMESSLKYRTAWSKEKQISANVHEKTFNTELDRCVVCQPVDASQNFAHHFCKSKKGSEKTQRHVTDLHRELPNAWR